MRPIPGTGDMTVPDRIEVDAIQMPASNGAKLLKIDTDARGEVALIDGQILAAQGDTAGAHRLLQEGIALFGQKTPRNYWLILIGQRALSELSAAARREPIKARAD